MATHLRLAAAADPPQRSASNNNQKKRKLTTSSSLAANLDLVREILLRIPATSIVRFKSVCKDWRDVMLHPSFLAAHTRRNVPRVSGVIVCDLCLRPNFYNFSCSILDGSRILPEPRWGRTPNEPRRVVYGKILQSCNGLLVGKYMPLEPSSEGGRPPINTADWVYNPTTLQYRILPHIPWRRYRGVVLAFDPLRSNNYGIVLLCDGPREVMLYRSETNSPWETLFSGDKDPWIGSLSTKNNYYCFCDGVVCWFTVDGFLISMDIEKRSFSKTTTTCLPTVQHSVSYCGQSRGGRLRLIRCYLPSDLFPLNSWYPGAMLEVLELASDRSNWILLHRVKISDLYGGISSDLTLNESVAYSACFIYWIPSCCCLVEDEESDKVVFIAGTKTVAYDLGRRTFQVLRTNGDSLMSRLVPCTSTLVAP